MATQAQDVIDGAIHRSSLNNADLVSTPELLRFMTLYERQVFLRGAQLDPDYFGTDGLTTVRTAATQNWDLAGAPGNVAALTEAEVTTIVGTVTGISVGTKINLIGFRWQGVDIAPRAFVRGRKVTAVGSELGTGANYVSQLKLFYSPVPAAIASATQLLSLPDEWTGLVELKLARLLALRDRRADEVALLNEEYTEMFSLFEAAVLAFNHGLRRPVNLVPAVGPLGVGTRRE